MNSRFLLKILLPLLVFGGLLSAWAVEVSPDVPDKHSFSESEWKRITKDIDYSKDTAPAESKRKPPRDFDFKMNPAIGKAIVFTIVFALLIFLLLRVMKGNILLGDKKINSENPFSNVGPEEDIHQSDLEKLYSEAMAAGNFRLAVRYCYLIIIRELSNKQLIIWKKEKTNTDYIFETMNNSFNKPFRENTFLFEKIWYGETELSEQNFLLVNTRFNEFISQVKNNNAAATGEAGKSAPDS